MSQQELASMVGVSYRT
ncbi:hypothetical protein, partial [Blautia obeum]